MSSFASLLKKNSEYQSIEYNVKSGRLPMGVLGLPLTPKAHLIHTLCEETGKKALIITNDEATATKVTADLQTMGTDAHLFPATDRNFRSEQNHSREYESRRLGVLGLASDNALDAVVCSIEAAMQLTIPKKALTDRTVVLENGRDAELDKVLNALVSAGYVRADMVEGAGQFAHRGAILDFFPPDASSPVRVEFWGDTIDSMAHFDILSQRRTENADAIRITPATEIVFDSDEVFADKIEALASHR